MDEITAMFANLEKSIDTKFDALSNRIDLLEIAQTKVQ